MSAPATVTVLTRTDSQPAGKTYSLEGKVVSNHVGSYHAETLCFDGDALDVLTQFKSLVERLQPDQSIILGHAPATGGAPYRIVPQKRLGDDVMRLIDGKPCIARIKSNFEPSRLLLLDFDPDERMPESWHSLDEAGRWAMLTAAFPEFAGAARLTIPSGSGRVLGPDGLPYKSGPLGSHTYIVLDRAVNSAELDDMRARLEARLWARGLGFMKESASGARLRRGLVDSAVWVAGREVFDGPPAVVEPLKLGPLVAVLEPGGFAQPLETLSEQDTEAFQARTGARVVRERVPVDSRDRARERVPRLAIEDYSSLRLSTMVETERGVMSVREFLDSGADKLRCQATFRESSSWAGILRRVGSGAILHDVGTSTTYRLIDAEIRVEGTLEKAVAQALDQGSARAVLARQLWRVPVQTGAAELVAMLAKDQAGIDARDLAEFADWLLSTRGGDALGAVRVVASDLPESVNIRHVTKMQTIYEAVATLPGVHLVKAPHAAGKTQSLLRPIALDWANVVAIAPRVSLVDDLCSRMDLDSYQEHSESSRLGICLNSISNPKFARPLNHAHVVLIDEIAKCAKECHTNKSTLGKNARKTWDKLTSLMKHAHLAIGVDADLSNLDLQLFADAGLQVNLWVIEETQRDLTAQFDRAANVVAGFKQAIAGGSRCLLVSDTAKRVAELSSWVRAEFPNKRVIEIHAKPGTATTGRDDVKRLLKDINGGVTGVDVLIMSPAVESGLSLNVEHFDRHFAIYSGTIEPAAFNQMLLRDRTAKCWSIGIQGSGKRDLPVDYENALNNLDAAQRVTDDVLSVFGSYVPFRARTAYDAFCCRVAIDGNKSRSDYAANLFELLRHRGWTVESRWSDVSPDGRDILDQARMLFDVESAGAILSGRTLRADEAERLRQQHAITPDESAALAKFDVAEAVAVDVAAVTPDDIEHWQDGRLIGQRALFDGLADVGVVGGDVDDALSDTAPALRGFGTARNAAARALFEALGISLTGDGVITKGSVLQAFADLEGTDHARILEHAGIARFDRPLTPDRAVRWAGDALAKFGLWLEVDKHAGAGGRDGRTYRLGQGAKVTRCRVTGVERFRLPGLGLMLSFQARARARAGAAVTVGCRVTPESIDRDMAAAVTADGLLSLSVE